MKQLQDYFGDRFGTVFKTIILDNGPEFAAFGAYETEETTIYFTHPYRASERPQNERHNGLLREYFLKGYRLPRTVRKISCNLPPKSTHVLAAFLIIRLRMRFSTQFWMMYMLLKKYLDKKVFKLLLQFIVII